MSKQVLAIYQTKKDKNYSFYQIYNLTEHFTKEYIEECCIKYNNDENHPDFVTLYFDDLLCKVIKEVGSSELFNDCISNLRSISSSIRCNIEDLESWDDTISELLENLKPESED